MSAWFTKIDAYLDDGYNHRGDFSFIELEKVVWYRLMADLHPAYFHQGRVMTDGFLLPSLFIDPESISRPTEAEALFNLYTEALLYDPTPR